MLASDLANPEFIGAVNADSALYVRFHIEPVQNDFKTIIEQRPIFEDVVFIEIQTPGNNLNVIDTPAREEHKRRFPLQWAHFQNSNSQESDGAGTPIEQWSILTRSQVEELRAMKFKKVDSIANASDQQIESIGMIAGMSPHTFRDKARHFLKVSADTAVVQKQADEIEKLRQDQIDRDIKYAFDLEEMRKQIEQLDETKKSKIKLWNKL